MKAMILAAGLGTRLKQFTETKPKPMVDVGGQPLLDINMKLLRKAFITNVIANLHYLPNVVIDHEKDNQLYSGFDYVVEDELLGSAGGLLNCSNFFKGQECFIVMSGDILTNTSLAKLMTHHLSLHKKYGTVCTMAIKEVDISETSQYGVVCDDEHGRVMQFQEKPKPWVALNNYVNTGIYVFDKSIFRYIRPGKFQDFAKDVFPRLLEKDLLGAYRIGKDYWNDIGTPEKYLKAIEDMSNGEI